ncbi:hypothetical protein ACIA49_03515 [Kribbella sp. NPDC051587]|uniref:hypothetical protein n=1 Tax=Kribbella sp. NPDC051587 TaxID=3364119 RepID=UPI00379A6F9C
MDERDAVALGYIGALVVHVSEAGERLHRVCPFIDLDTEELRAYALVRFARLWDIGPEPDGWGIHPSPSGDGIQYQLLLRRVELPDLDSDTQRPL